MSDDFDLGPAVADASNVLLVAPGVGDTADRLCHEVMTADGPSLDHVISVSIGGSPEETAAAWRDRLGNGPSVSCLSVDGVTRSTARQASAQTVGGATIEYVDGSESVRKLGNRVAGKIRRDEETVVCFDSVTELQECLGQESAFEFLHALGSRIRAGGATGYFYMDRTVHDEETMTLYSTLFDAVVEVGSDTTE